MKTTLSINALCVLIIIFLVTSILLPAAAILSSLGAGMVAGWNAEPGSEPALSPVEVSYDPDIDELTNPSMKIKFESGEQLPVIMHQGIVMVPTERLKSNFAISICIYAAMLAVIILLIIDFIKFVININKGKIFEHQNVKYLGRFGFYLILSGVLSCVDGILRQIEFSGVSLTLNGYSISSVWEIPWTTFLLGLLSLLMARVWSMGLKLKEEQQLTI